MCLFSSITVCVCFSVVEPVVKHCQICEMSFDSWMSAYMRFREHRTEDNLATFSFDSVDKCNDFRADSLV